MSKIQFNKEKYLRLKESFNNVEEGSKRVFFDEQYFSIHYVEYLLQYLKAIYR